MADKLTSADIPRVGVQSDVLSPPIDISQQNLKNKINELITEQASLAVGTTNAETSDSRPHHTSLKLRLDSINSGQVSYLKEGGAVSERATPVMSVKVSALQANIDGIDVNIGFCTWTRVTTVITVTEPGHQRSNGQTVDVEVSSDSNALTLGEQAITNVSGDDYELVGVDTGDSSGTCENATIMATVTGPGSNTRLDYVVMNTTNSPSILTGTSAVDPVFPTVATTQLVLGCLVVKDTPTTSLNDDVEIFTLIEGDRNFPDHYIGTSTTFNQGVFNFNNLIIDSTLTVDASSSTIDNIFFRQMIVMHCRGNLHLTNLGSIVRSATHIITANGNDNVGVTGAVVGLKGGTLINLSSNSGAAGNSGSPGLIGSGTNPGAGGTGGVGGVEDTDISPAIIIKSENAKLIGTITLEGDDGSTGSLGGGGGAGGVPEGSGGGGGAGGGGGGGAPGGNLIIYAIKDIDISSVLNFTGGDGGTGGAGNAGGNGLFSSGDAGGGTGGASGNNFGTKSNILTAGTNGATGTGTGGAGGSGGGSGMGGGGGGAGGTGGTGGPGGNIILIYKTITDTATFNQSGGLAGAAGAGGAGGTGDGTGASGSTGTSGGAGAAGNTGQKITNEYDVSSVITNLLNIIGEFI